MHFDILISGAGPAGLCLAQALSGQGLAIGMVEQQPQAAIAAPAFDGREIALTQPSADTLRRLGLWQRINDYDAAALSPLCDAKVTNGPSPFALTIGHGLTARSELGWLVSNHLIRRAAWDAVQHSMAQHGDITLIAGDGVARVAVGADAAQVTLASGATHSARLLVAADSRFSPTRRAVGIGAAMHDFGRSMLVCQMTHDVPHEHTAWEWFGHGQTLALLPMNDDPVTGAHRASVVLTLPHQQIEPLLALDEAAFNSHITRRFDARLGAMGLASTRHACLRGRRGGGHAPGDGAWLQLGAAECRGAFARAAQCARRGARRRRTRAAGALPAHAPPGHAPAVRSHTPGGHAVHRRGKAGALFARRRAARGRARDAVQARHRGATGGRSLIRF